MRGGDTMPKSQRHRIHGLRTNRVPLVVMTIVDLATLENHETESDLMLNIENQVMSLRAANGRSRSFPQ